MCGIAGILSFGGAADPELVGKMSNLLAHRGPDDAGVWQSSNQLVCLAHRRLSILDISRAGHQPMLSADGSVCLVYNGEIYNFRELRAELKASGSTFRSETDTEVLLHAYQKWGHSVPDRLVGMFAFAIWDDREKVLFLARDRAGEKPLYYSHGVGRFAFASEYNAVKPAIPGQGTIDPDGLALYLRYQSIPAPYSIVREVRKLPAAHCLTVSATGEMRSWRYWDPVRIARGEPARMSEREAVSELGRLVDNAVKRQLCSDVPLGAFLSGGIDSSLVVESMTRESSTPVRTFTIGFDIPGFDESPHAAAVATHLGTEHHAEYLSSQDALDLVPRIPEMYGEPFADSSALPTYLVSRTARKKVTVALSGDGGDEVFGGYTRYDWMDRLNLINKLTRPVSPLLRETMRRLPGRAGRAAKLFGLPPREAADFFSGPFARNEVFSLVGRCPSHQERDRAWYDVQLPTTRRHAMLADFLTYLPDTILAKVDRASMAVSLETRAPLLDPSVVEFALRLPPNMLIGKQLLKRLAFDRMPRALLERPKAGFGIPLNAWLRGPLRELLRESTGTNILERLGIRRAPVQAMIQEHEQRVRNHGARLWSLMILGLWHQYQRSES